MKSIEVRVPDYAGFPPEPVLELGGVRTYLAVLQHHVLQARPQDLLCILTITQSIGNLAPAMRLFETAKRAKALRVFARSMIGRESAAGIEERALLSRAFDRLVAAAAEEGVV